MKRVCVWLCGLCACMCVCVFHAAVSAPKKVIERRQRQTHHKSLANIFIENALTFALTFVKVKEVNLSEQPHICERQERKFLKRLQKIYYSLTPLCLFGKMGDLSILV